MAVEIEELELRATLEADPSRPAAPGFAPHDAPFDPEAFRREILDACAELIAAELRRMQER